MGIAHSHALLPSAAPLRLVKGYAVLAACFVASAGRAQSRNPPPVMSQDSVAPMAGVSRRALALYRAAYVVDMHNDLPSRILDDRYDPDVRHGAGFAGQLGSTDLPRLVESGITAVFLSDFVDARYVWARPDGSYRRAVLMADAIHSFVARHPDRLLFATTAADVRRAKAEGRIAVFIGVEGGHAIENSIEKLRDLHRRGARYLTLTWNNGNEWAGSSVGSGGTRTGGLTDLGRQIVREMNRLGVLVDLSHVSDETFADALSVSTAPVIASHSAARAIGNHPRNLTDDQIRALAQSGGVVNINFFSRFIDPAQIHAAAEMKRRLDEARDSLRARHPADPHAVSVALEALQAALRSRLPRTPLSVLIDHFDHVARVGGVDHVGIGSDFDGVSDLPDGMEDVTRLPRIAQGLLDRGYSEEDVRKMLGGNMMRVMQQVLDRRAGPDR
ncbi:MAG: dipeptidase [Gemmatimonadota bacterium]|nr:dipeptidase [Gemmatimonadota bacterium]